jgi:excisionase family DNA binding protein
MEGKEMTTAMAGEFLRVEKIAERLDVGYQTVLTWLQSGRLKGYRLGGTRAGWRVKPEDLEQFLAERANRPDGEA